MQMVAAAGAPRNRADPSRRSGLSCDHSSVPVIDKAIRLAAIVSISSTQNALTPSPCANGSQCRSSWHRTYRCAPCRCRRIRPWLGARDGRSATLGLDHADLFQETVRAGSMVTRAGAPGKSKRRAISTARPSAVAGTRSTRYFSTRCSPLVTGIFSTARWAMTMPVTPNRNPNTAPHSPSQP